MEGGCASDNDSAISACTNSFSRSFRWTITKPEISLNYLLTFNQVHGTIWTTSLFGTLTNLNRKNEQNQRYTQTKISKTYDFLS